MSNSENLRDLEFRVALLERGLTSLTSQIRELTAALGSLARRAPVDEGAEPITIGPDSVAPFGTGFYRREEESGGRSFRWTGRGDHFEFRVGLNRNLSWSFAMELRPNAQVPAAQLRAFVDYVEIAVQADAAGRFVTGMIPVREFANAATLTFFLPKTFKPNEADPNSKDGRTLGIAFYEMKLEPAGIEKSSIVNGANVAAVGGGLPRQTTA